MGRIVQAAIFVLAAASTSSGQWIERQVYLPDSLARVTYPSQVLFNPGNNIILVGGASDGLLALDGVTGRRLALIPLGGRVEHMLYVSEYNLVYVIAGEGVDIVDPAALRRIGRMESGMWLRKLCWNRVEEKLYALGDRDVAVFDAQAETLLATIDLGFYLDDFCCNPLGNRLYCGDGIDIEGYYIVDCATDSVTGYVWTGEDDFRMLYSEPANRAYISEVDDEDVAIIDGSTDSLVTYVWSYGPPWDMVASSDGAKVFVADPFGHRLWVIDASGDSLSGLVMMDSMAWPTMLVYNGIDRTVYCWSEDRFIVVDADADSMLTSFAFEVEPEQLVHEPVQNRLLLPLSSSNELCLLDCSTNSVAGRVLTGFRPELLAYSPASRKVYCADAAQPTSVLALDTDTRRVLARAVAPAEIRGLHHSPLGDKLYLLDGYGDGPSAVLDCATDSIVALLEVRDAVGCAVTVPAGKVYIPASLPDTDVVSVVDAYGDSIIRQIPVRSGVLDIGCNTDGNQVYAALAGSDMVTVLDAGPDTVLAEVAVPHYPTALAWVGTRNAMCCVCYFGDTLVAIDGITNVVTFRIPMPDYPAELLYNPVADKLYCVCEGQMPSLVVIDCTTMEPITYLVLPQRASMVLDTLNNRLHVFVQNYRDTRVLVLDGATDSLVGEYVLPATPHDVAWSPEEHRFYYSLPDSGSVVLVRDSIPTGMEEWAGTSGVVAEWTTPTVVQGVLSLPRRPLAGGMRPQLLDVSGRKVADLVPGPNDLRHLAPGVYFLRSAVGREPSAVQKVIVQR